MPGRGFADIGGWSPRSPPDDPVRSPPPALPRRARPRDRGLGPGRIRGRGRTRGRRRRPLRAGVDRRPARPGGARRGRDGPAPHRRRDLARARARGRARDNPSPRAPPRRRVRHAGVPRAGRRVRAERHRRRAADRPGRRLGRPAVGPRRPVRHQRARRVGRRRCGPAVPGGRRVRVAVVDTGVAYADRGRLRRSPDLGASRLLRGHDFVGNDPYPNDENGHGTFVASTIAASANNGYGMVGIAYAADILPVRVLNADGGAGSARIARGHPLRRQPRRAGHQRVDRAHRPGDRPAGRAVDHERPRDPRGDPLRPQPGRHRRRRGRQPRPGRRAVAHARHATSSTSAARPSTAASATTPTTARASTSSPRAAARTPTLPGDPSCRVDLPPGRNITEVSVPPLARRRASSCRSTTTAPRWPPRT